MNLIFIGAPGTGKGTHSKKVATIKGLAHISTGEILRDNISMKTPLGIEADKYISKGDLVPDNLVLKIIKDKIDGKDCANGFILDGFPRTLGQTLELEKILSESGRKIDAAINMVADEDELLDRLQQRRICILCQKTINLAFDHIKNNKCPVCGGELILRDDDKTEVIKLRFATHNRQIDPILSYYKDKGLLINVSSAGSVEETHRNVMEALQDLK